MRTNLLSKNWIHSSYSTGLSLVLLCLLLAGCSSTPPPAALPAARIQAGIMADAATKLTSVENWSAAARQWRATAERFAALNDLVSQAAALHNLAQAQRELYQSQSAQSNLLMAAALNIEVGQTNAWWRNQIALLQLTQEHSIPVSSTNLDLQFTQLSGRVASLTDSEIKGLFYNEQERWLLRQGDYSHASNALERAELAFAATQYQIGQAAVAENYARLLLAQSNWTASIHAWDKALNTCKMLGDMNGIARSLEGQGETFLKQGNDLDSAEKLLRRASTNFGLARRPFAQCRSLELLIECLAKHNKSITTEQSELATAHESCASLMESAGNLSRAREHWQASLHLWQTLNQSEAATKAEAGVQRCNQTAQ
jgi:tetratricopeptide (TPR) repeat protein